MALHWTSEELREMAESDAAIDAEVQVDLELSRKLDRAALDDRLDAKHLHKLQYHRAYYQAHRDRILKQNRESKERNNYIPKRDPEREKARMHDYYERNKDRWKALEESNARRVAQCNEYAAHKMELQRQRNKRKSVRRRERMAADPEYRERINAQKREAYRRRVEADPGYREEINRKRRERKAKQKEGGQNGITERHEQPGVRPPV